MPRLIARLLPMLSMALVSLLASAQTQYPLPVFVPSAPTSRDEIVAVVQTPGICVAEDGGTSVSASLVRTDIVLGNCVIGAPNYFVDTRVTFGPLSPGTYSYVVYHDWQLGSGPELVSTQQLVVLPTAEPVSTLTSSAQIATVLLMASAGVLFLHRRCG